MEGAKRYGGLDRARLLAALLVVANHTSPLLSYSETADFLLTRVLARLAVPFFLMVTGQFLLADPKPDTGRLCRFLGKTGLLYAAAMLLYLPLNLYAGHFRGLGAWDVARMVVLDGTFYHLWYLPAVLLGVGLVYLLRRHLPFWAVAAVAAALYLVGLLGDSYYGLATQIPGISTAMEGVFSLFSYTRNGLFLAPLFLVLGSCLGRPGPRQRPGVAAVGGVLTLGLLLGEGLLLCQAGWPRHDSMYLLLPVCVFCLYQLALSWRAKPVKGLAAAATWVYVTHPLCIVLLRGAAKALGLEALLMDSLVFFLGVSGLSILSAAVALWLFRGPMPTDGRAWTELDTGRLRRNVAVLGARLPTGCALMPAVKADAYGHGAVTVAKLLNREGVRAFCVATAREGAQLRRHGVRGEILVLGYTHRDQVALLRRWRLTQTVLDEGYAQMLGGGGGSVRAQIKIDTGMHRLGEGWDHLDAIGRIFEQKRLRITGVFTHLWGDGDEALAQGKVFYDTVAALERRGYAIGKVHLLASGGLLAHPELGGDYARVGIALYGGVDDGGLRPVLAVKARVALVRDLAQGEGAGYGQEFMAGRDTRLAVLAIGYADGLPRGLSSGVGAVLLHGCVAPIVGRVCMDQTLVDVTDIPEVRPGDVAVVIGQSGDREITAQDMAAQTGTIANEILSRLGQRLERRVV